MGLKLQSVPAAAGLRWVRQAFEEFFHHPLAYSGMLVGYVLACFATLSLAGSLAVFSNVFAYIGACLVVMGMPLLTLAFMMGTHGRLQGRLVHVGLYFAPWRQKEPDRRRALLQLLLASLATTLAAFALLGLVDDGALDALQEALFKGTATEEEMARLVSAPGLASALFWRMVVTGLVSVPFWFAPALVFWGGQGAAQSMFSSALALWRARGAFALYLLGWAAAMLTAMLLVSFMLALLGASVTGLVAMPLGLVLSSAFYVSLYFSFRDCFGEPY